MTLLYSYKNPEMYMKTQLIIIFIIALLQELKGYVRSGTLKLRTAFSRDQAEKIYVTHLLENDADLVWQVIQHNGHIFICG